MPKLVLDFDNEADRMDFVEWFLDGSGEQDWFMVRSECRGLPSVSTDPPAGQDDWDWNITPSAETHTIRVTRVPEEM